MALALALNSLGNGNFSEAFNYLFVDQSEIDRAKQLSEDLVAVTEAEATRGVITPAEAEKRKAQITLDGSYTYQFAIPELNPFVGFQAGLEEGRQNIQDSIGNTVKGSLGFTAGLIPTWVWVMVVAGVGIFLFVKFK